MKSKSIIKMLAFTPLFFTSILNAQTGVKKADVKEKLKSVENLDKVVNIAFGTAKKTDAVASFSSVRPTDRITYDNTQWVKDYIQGLLLGVRGSGNIRGFKDEALFVIDGIPGRNVDLLLTTEIEEITVLKDIVGNSLYGSQGRNGVVLITTKRGKVNKNSIAVNANFGVNTNIALPNYLRASEYMSTYNEARTNDGLTPFYSNEQITNSAPGSNTNPYKYPDVDFYGDNIVRKYTPFTNLVTEFTGGTDKVQYYVNLAYKYDGNNVKFNPDINKGTNLFNVRGNIDFKINKNLSSSVDVVTYIASRKQAQNNLMEAGTTFLPNLYSPLLPVSMVDPQLLANSPNIKIYDGYILGVDNRYKSKLPFADVYAKGYERLDYKNVQVSNSVNLNLGMITKGLSAKTYLSMDYWDVSKISVTNKFNYYEPTWKGDTIIALAPKGDPDLKDQTENVSNEAYNVRYGFSGQIDYKRTFADIHHVDATLLAFSNSIMNKDVKQVDMFGHFGLRLNYDFKSKYYISLTGVQNFSTKLPENTRSGFSPTLGLAYAISNEAFMKNVDWIDFLRLKFSTGTLKSDLNIKDYFMYQGVYTSSNSTLNDGRKTYSVMSAERGENLNLGFEERKEISFGVEAQLFKSFELEGSVFRNDITNQFVRMTNAVYPSYYGDFIPWSNYNADRYKGFELGANYSTKFGKLNATFGANVLYADIEVLKRDEIYKFDYQYRVGRSNSAMFGLQADGLYTAEDFDVNGKLLEILPQPNFGTVRPGDIKYLDQNDDNIIDSNDEHEIGRWDQPLNFSANVKLNYHNFTLFVLADAQSGGNAMIDNSYYRPKSADKYSTFVRNRWTIENPNPNAIVPRLSTQDAANNYRSSTYWMYDNSYISIKRAQLTYEFDSNFVKKLGMSGLSLDIAGSNLFRFAKNKEYQELSIGGNPQKRYYTIGLRMTL